MDSVDRRSFLGLLAWPVLGVSGQQRATSSQGMSSRGVPPSPRGKPSGIPFHARFTDIADRAGLKEPVVSGHTNRADYIIESMTGGAAFLDYDRDGHLDLFVSNYVKFDISVPRPGEPGSCHYQGVPVFCGPRGLPYGHHSLYHNNGDGTFTDVTASSGIGKAEGGYGLTVVSADFDNDGWPDIYVACDSTPSLLFRNNHDGTFSEQGLERGVALSNDGMEQAGMGVAVGDFMLNGCLDIIKTHFSEDTLGVYRNDGSGIFWDVSRNAGLAVETRYVEWGVGLVDLDNDGKPDIFAVTGD